MEKRSERRAGDVIARRPGDTRLVFDFVDPQGTEFGHVEDRRGSHPTAPVIAVLAKGYWTIEPDPEPAVAKFAPGLVPVLKHGNHDQKTHGRRFATTVDPAVAAKAISLVGENGGLSIKMTDGSEPPDGYMVARDSAKFGTALTADEFYGPGGAKALGEFLIRNRSELGSGRAYLGIWHQTEITHEDGSKTPLARKDQVVHLDVTDRIVDRDRAVRLGRRRNQISIWDVANFEEIQTGGTGAEVAKGTDRRGEPEAAERDDRRRDHGVVGAGPRADGGAGLAGVLKHGSPGDPGYAAKHPSSRAGGGDLPAGWARRSDEERTAEIIGRARSDWAGAIPEDRLEAFAAEAIAGIDEYTGPNGTTLRVHTGAGVPDDAVQHQMALVSSLQALAPVPGLEVVISDGPFDALGLSAGSMGYNEMGTTRIHLRPRAVTEGKVDATGGLMPVFDGDRTAYAIVHEYGHVLDKRDARTASDDKATVITSHQTGMSRYAFDDEDPRAVGREAFAEAWTGWVGTRGQSDKPFVRYFADKYGWDAGGDGRLPSAGFAKATGLILVDTFDEDGAFIVEPPAPAIVKFAPGLRPVLKHGSPGEPGYSQKHPGGGSGPADGPYAAWGDRAREIQFAQRIGPSEQELRAVLSRPVPDDEDVRELMESRYEDDIEYTTNERIQNWREGFRDQEGREPTEAEVGDMADEIRRGVVDDMLYGYEGDEVRDDLLSDAMQQKYDEAAGLAGDFDEVYGVYHSFTHPDGREDSMQATVVQVEFTPGDLYSPSVINVRGIILNEDGEDVGEFDRAFTLRDDGSLVVSHELLRIYNDDYQGRGFAGTFNRQAENYYISHGIPAVQVHAALDGGGYAWARQGFDFTSPGTVPSRLQQYLVSSEAATLPRQVRADLDDIDRRFSLPRSHADYPTPYEIAMVGHVPGASTWPGKKIMRGSDWFGAKPMQPEGRRSTTQRRKEWEEEMAEYSRSLTRRQVPGQTTLDNEFASAEGQIPGQKPLFGLNPGVVDSKGRRTE